MSKKLTRELIAQKAKSDRIQDIKNINLWGSNIDNIDIIADMPSLEIVSLSINKITTLKPFDGLPNLKELYLRKNLITDINEIRFLTNCDNLRILWLSENPISDMKNYRKIIVQNLPQLAKLDDVMITDAERDGSTYDKDDNVDDDNIQQEKNMYDDEDRYNKHDNYRENQKPNLPSYDEEENNNYENININRGVNKNRYQEVGENYSNESPVKRKKTYQRSNYKNLQRNYEEVHNEEAKPKVRRIQTAQVRQGDYYGNNDFPFEGNNGMNYENFDNNYNRNRKSEIAQSQPIRRKKRSNETVLSCVLMLVGILTKDELLTVKREIEKNSNTNNDYDY